MPELARRQYDRQQYRINHYNTSYYSNQGYAKVVKDPVPMRRTVNTKKVERNYLIHRLVSVAVVSLLGFTFYLLGLIRLQK